jgi:ketosteroid isomerase-like protein
MERISPEKVRAEIKRFWAILSGKSEDKLEELYTPEAFVFTGKARRPEPVMLAIARRGRRDTRARGSVNAELGPVELQLIDEIAIATYTYQYSEERMNESGARSQRNTLYGRATQIFRAEPAGVVRIVHEHLSAAVPPEQGKSS